MTPIRGTVVATGQPYRQLVEVFESGQSLGEIVASHRLHRVGRHLPQGPWTSTWLENLEPNEVITQVAVRGDAPVVVIFDPRGGDHDPYLNIDWNQSTIKAAAFISADVSSGVLHQLDVEIKRGGLVSAGRLWGPAGCTRWYVRPDSLTTRIHAWAADIRVRAGATVVRFRDRIKARPDFVSPLDAVPWRPAMQPARFVIEDLANNADAWEEGREFQCPVIEPSIQESAAEAYERFGVYPISFSHPRTLPLQESIASALSYVTPGFPYSFEDEHEYLSHYNRFALGLTHRKAGWDCFRHVEILAAGAVPLMPDVQSIPPFSMIHYPKLTMQTVLDNFATRGLVPDKATREGFRDYFLENLTTSAMARYLLTTTGVDAASRILFLDQHTPNNPEYLSTLTLIGLKELLGDHCDVAYPAEFLYTNSQTDTRGFYGRGFGYTKVLDPALRNESEKRSGPAPLDQRIKDAEVLIVGSVSRNRHLADHLLERFADKRIILIHGEDTPPEKQDYHRLTAPGVTGFVRSIDRES